MEKNEFDELKEIMQTEEDMQFNKRIEKSMTKKLTRKVYKRLLLGFLTVILSLGVFHVVCKGLSYNPLKENIDFNYLMNAYLWTYVPDHHAEVIKIKDKGFGFYDATMHIHDVSDPLIYGSGYYPVSISFSDISMDDLYLAGMKNLAVNEFDYVANSGYGDYFKENPNTKKFLLNEFEKLPDSAIVLASVNLNNRLDLDQVVDLIKKYPDSNFTWLAMEQPKFYQGLTTGIDLSKPYGFESLNEYPHFMELFKNYRNDLTAEQLKNHYLDVLKVLVDHPKFYKMMSNYEMNASYERLVAQYEFSQQELHCVGFRIHANPKDLIEIIESGMVSMVWVDDVKLSIYSK